MEDLTYNRQGYRDYKVSCSYKVYADMALIFLTWLYLKMYIM